MAGLVGDGGDGQGGAAGDGGDDSAAALHHGGERTEYGGVLRHVYGAAVVCAAGAAREPGRAAGAAGADVGLLRDVCAAYSVRVPCDGSGGAVAVRVHAADDDRAAGGAVPGAGGDYG